MTSLQTGIVIGNPGNEYTVRSEGKDYPCRLKGRFKIKGIRTTNPIAIGDRVRFSIPEGSGESFGGKVDLCCFITEILPRKNYIIRRSINLSKEAHIIGANLDRALLIVTINYPETPLTFIDRFLATAEAYGVEAALVFNKIDLYSDEEQQMLGQLCKMYEEIGYRCFSVSAIENKGMEFLREYVSRGVTLLSGQSGVGKSSIINALVPTASLRTASISSTHLAGVHTTTYSTMIDLPGEPDSFLIDTPGIKGFGTLDFDPKEVGHFFPEIFQMSKSCRFSNCTHTHEPGCAVNVAVEEGHISESRFRSYLSILEDKDEAKYREAY